MTASRRREPPLFAHLYWSIRERWCGFLVAALLDSVDRDGSTADRYPNQTSIAPDKGIYTSTIPLADALRARMLPHRSGEVTYV